MIQVIENRVKHKLFAFRLLCETVELTEFPPVDRVTFLQRNCGRTWALAGVFVGIFAISVTECEAHFPVANVV